MTDTAAPPVRPPAPNDKPTSAEDDRPMGLRGHLLELRTRLRNAAIALFIATIAAFWFSKPMFALLAHPLTNAMAEAKLGDTTLYYNGLTEAFWVQCKVAIYAGIFLASPFIFHQIWSFIAPGLYRRERRIAVPFAAFSGIFFIGGALFCYFLVFPAAFRFFLSYSNHNMADLSDVIGKHVSLGTAVTVKSMPFMDDYLDLVLKMLVAFGLVFEMPLLIFFLSAVGLVTHRSLWKFNRYWTVIAFVIAAVLTPGPDVMSQLLMAAPLIGLYNLSILMSYIITKRREARNPPAPPPPPDDDDDADAADAAGGTAAKVPA